MNRTSDPTDKNGVAPTRSMRRSTKISIMTSSATYARCWHRPGAGCHGGEPRKYQPPRFQSSSLMRRPIPAPFGTDASELDDLGPLCGFGGDELLAFGRRHGHRCDSEVRKPCFEPWIGKNAVHLLVKYLDDLGWRARGRP